MTLKLHCEIVNNLIDENISPFKCCFLSQDVWYLGIVNLSKTHISQNKSFNIDVSIWLATLTHIFNGYDISFNTKNYPIFNMQDFRKCVWSRMFSLFRLSCIPSTVSPLSPGHCASEVMSLSQYPDITHGVCWAGPNIIRQVYWSSSTKKCTATTLLVSHAM